MKKNVYSLATNHLKINCKKYLSVIVTLLALLLLHKYLKLPVPEYWLTNSGDFVLAFNVFLFSMVCLPFSRVSKCVGWAEYAADVFLLCSFTAIVQIIMTWLLISPWITLIVSVLGVNLLFVRIIDGKKLKQALPSSLKMVSIIAILSIMFSFFN